ncbi:hypothetical protein AcV7_007744 [Taiwanofungus camphoratus]|nr:hypothetical protein AcV7_007744 [Antrodia cinnamomea]
MAFAVAHESTDVARLSLSLDHPASTSPFPSPGSPFLPPPRLSAHEFALRPTPANPHMRSTVTKRRSDDSPVAGEDLTPTTAKSAHPLPSASPPVTPTPNGITTFQSQSQGQSQNQNQSQNQSRSPPSTPTITIPDTVPSTPPNLSPISASHRDSLTSSRPAPPSPAVSRRASAALSRRSSSAKSRRQSRVPQITPTHEPHASSSSPLALATEPTTPVPAPPPTPPPKRRSLLVKIRDFAFAPSDARHVGRGTHVPRANRTRRRASTSSDASSSSAGSAPPPADDEDPRGGWGAFRWNTLSSHFSWGARPRGDASAPGAAAGGGPSRTDFERNFDVSSPTEEVPDPYGDADSLSDGEDTCAAGEEGPLVPGLYRALFAFEPEGTAEMALEEEQLVHVVARGGGVGWAVVLKEGGGHALVPESYLELVQPDTDTDADADSDSEV